MYTSSSLAGCLHGGALGDAGGTIGGQRLIVFVLGGLSYSELRTLTEVQEATPSRDLLLGGTAMLTPRQFLIDLKDLKQLQVSGV